MDRSRYDSAMFWLPFGTAAAVIGLALMTIGVTRLPVNANVFASVWFDAGLALLAVGGLMLLWSLLLYLARRKALGRPAGGEPAGGDRMAEAIKGYYAEREKLIDIWDRQQKGRRKK